MRDGLVLCLLVLCLLVRPPAGDVVLCRGSYGRLVGFEAWSGSKLVWRTFRRRA
jgi:hypothetical protein